MSGDDPGIHWIPPKQSPPKAAAPSPAPPPSPEPEHQQRITRQKIFEIVVVVSLIIAATGYLMWRNYQSSILSDRLVTLEQAERIILQEDFVRVEKPPVLGMEGIALEKELEVFECTVELFAAEPDSSLELALIWLSPKQQAWQPDGTAMQDAVDTVLRLAGLLFQSAPEAFETAVNTMAEVVDTPRPHRKGVGQTDDGWKVTYVTFHNFDEDAAPVPALVLALHDLDAAGAPERANFNRRLYGAIQQGSDIDAAIRAEGSGIGEIIELDAVSGPDDLVPGSAP